MDPYTGKLATTPEELEALKREMLGAGRDPADIVELIGPVASVRRISDAVKAERRRKAKAAKKSRKANR
jgi:hypothetical protein